MCVCHVVHTYEINENFLFTILLNCYFPIILASLSKYLLFCFIYL